MSYYDNNGQWSAPGQNNWEHQGNPIRTGASGPQPQDDFAFAYQFDEVDRALDNLNKSGKMFAMAGRPGARMPQLMSPQRPHAAIGFDDSRSHQPGIQNFYVNQRHTQSRSPNDAEQVLQAKRRMAAQRERELRNLHTEQQFQRNLTPTAVLSEATFTTKPMSEEETRQLIARQRSALYGEGPFADKASYVDETGAIRSGAPAASGPSSVRGHSPLPFEPTRANSAGDVDLTTSASSSSTTPAEPSQQQQQQQQQQPQSQMQPQPQPQPQSHQAASQDSPPVAEVGSGAHVNNSPQPQQPVSGSAASKSVFDGSSAQLSRTITTSPANSATKSCPKLDLAATTKFVPNTVVAPIGTRPLGPTGTSTTTASSAIRSTTPLASPSSWVRGNSVWGQASGLGSQASVWG